MDSRIELINVKFTPIEPNPSLSKRNPIAKVPTLISDDGTAIYDSRVICEYLDSLHVGPKMFPTDSDDRWRTLTLQALADAVLDAGVLIRYETFSRPPEYAWPDWVRAQTERVLRAVETMEGRIGELTAGIGIGSIAAACALSYLDFRFADDIDWRGPHADLASWYDLFAKRDSMQSTILEV